MPAGAAARSCNHGSLKPHAMLAEVHKLDEFVYEKLHVDKS